MLFHWFQSLLKSKQDNSIPFGFKCQLESCTRTTSGSFRVLFATTPCHPIVIIFFLSLPLLQVPAPPAVLCTSISCLLCCHPAPFLQFSVQCVKGLIGAACSPTWLHAVAKGSLPGLPKNDSQVHSMRPTPFLDKHNAQQKLLLCLTEKWLSLQHNGEGKDV